MTDMDQSIDANYQVPDELWKWIKQLLPHPDPRKSQVAHEWMTPLQEGRGVSRQRRARSIIPPSSFLPEMVHVS